MYSTFNNNTIDSPNDSSNDSSICYICFENKQKLKLECEHTICKECLITFLKSSLHNNCPWCRQNISTEQVKKLLPSEYNRIICFNICAKILKFFKALIIIFFLVFLIIITIYSKIQISFPVILFNCS